MTKRSDIEPDAQTGRRSLSYTRRCGWVGWGHALPGAARTLQRQIFSEQPKERLLAGLSVTYDGRPAYALRFGEQMSKAGVVAASSFDYVITKSLSRSARESAALGIFLTGSVEFETMQSSFPYSWVTTSGFSAEDLVSDLIGFYIAFHGYSTEQMRQICGEVSVAESYRLWDEHLTGGLGALKNHSVRPILFPTNEGVRSPADTVWPHELATIRPAAEGTTWVRPTTGYIYQRWLNLRAAITVSRTGQVDAAKPGSTAIPRSAGRR